MAAAWLLLAHQLPKRLSNARVKTWRRLQHIGAIPNRNSVYVLPNTEQAREDFEWMRKEIVALGGEATVFAAEALNPMCHRALVRAFQQARDADYDTLKCQAERLSAALRSKRTASPAGRRRIARSVRALRERLTTIEQIDFFSANGRQEAGEALAALERRLGERAGSNGRSPQTLVTTDFEKRRWVTRPRPGVDRMASAWLIRRAIDPHATFAFADAPKDGEIAFDMYAGEFGHQGSLCTFETLAERFGLTDPSVTRIGQIVHDLDMKETRYAAPEVPAVGRMIDGLRQMHPDDHVLLEHGIAMFEALARSFEATAEAATSAPRTGRRRRSKPA